MLSTLDHTKKAIWNYTFVQIVQSCKSFLSCQCFSRRMAEKQYCQSVFKWNKKDFVKNSQVLGSVSQRLVYRNGRAKKDAVTERHVKRWQILKDSLKNPVRGNLSLAPKPAASKNLIVECMWLKNRVKSANHQSRYSALGINKQLNPWLCFRWPTFFLTLQLFTSKQLNL